MNLYKRLGLENDATTAQIKAAYRKMAKKYHPDKNGGNHSKEWLDIKEAYDVLIDIDKRTEYDRTGDIPGGEPTLSPEEMIRRQAVERILVQYTMILDSWEEDTKFLLNSDPFEIIREKLTEAAEASLVFKEKMRRIINNLKVYNTHCVKDTTNGTIFINLVNSRIDSANRAIKKAEQEDEIVNISHELLMNVEFIAKIEEEMELLEGESDEELF